MANKRPREDNHYQHRDNQYNNHNHHRGPKAQKTQHTQQNGRDGGRNYNNGTLWHKHNYSTPQPSTSTNTSTPPIVPVALLDAKFPETTPLPPVSVYNPSSSSPSIPTSSPNNTNTPPPPALPPLPPGPLSTAPFTHPSIVDSKHARTPDTTTSNYERLEFLGDAYLELIATRLIYSRFPTLPCGRQAQIREKLVKNSTLASFARLYGFRERVRWSGISSMEVAKHRGGWEKVEADVFEAYVAAVVEGWPEEGGKGFRMVETWLTALWAGILLSDDIAAGVGRGVVNRKDELTRLVGGRSIQLLYREIPPEDPAASAELLAKHGAQAVRVGVFLTGWGWENALLGEGVGIGKKEAGMLAAGDALEGERRWGIVEEIAEAKRRGDEGRRAAMAAAAEAQAEARAVEVEGEEEQQAMAEEEEAMTKEVGGNAM